MDRPSPTEVTAEVVAVTTEDSAAAETDVEQVREKLRRLPPEVGAVLVGVGVLGMILPGPVGTPIFLAGAVVLVPGMFERCERWTQKRFPQSHRIGMRYVERFIDDLEKRYPNAGQHTTAR